MEPINAPDLKCGNLLDDDERQLLAKLSTRFAGSRNEIAKLQARVLALESENSDLKCDTSVILELKRENSMLKSENSELKLCLEEKESDLKDTQALIGQYVLTASRQGHTNSFANPSRLPQPSLKRARSASLEFLESPQPSRKKSKEISTGPSLESEIASQLQPPSPNSKVARSSQSDFKRRSIELETNEISAPQAEIIEDIPREGGENPPTSTVSSNIISSEFGPAPEISNQPRPQAIPPPQETEARTNSPTTDALSTVDSSCIASSLAPSDASINPKPVHPQLNLSPREDNVTTNVHTNDVLSLPDEGVSTVVASFGASSLMSSPAPESPKQTGDQTNPIHREDQAKTSMATQKICIPPEKYLPSSSDSTSSSMPSLESEASQPAQTNPTSQGVYNVPCIMKSRSKIEHDNLRTTAKAMGVFTLRNDGQVILATASLPSSSTPAIPKQGCAQLNLAPEEERAKARPTTPDPFTPPSEGPATLATSSNVILSTSSLAPEAPKQSGAQLSPASGEDKVKPNTEIVINDLSKCPPIAVASSNELSLDFPSAAENPKPTSGQTNLSSLSGMAKFYLKSTQALTITPPPLDLEVPRAFLRLTYGGSDQHWLQFIPECRNPCGPVQRRIVFPKQELNPAMPTAPGEPGLVFASRHEILSNPPWMVFRKRSKAPAVWRYLGEYECVLCGTMTAEQFKSLAPEVKREWAKALLTTKAFDVYVAMRARIALRIAGIIPIEDKEKESKLVDAEILAVKCDKGQPVTEAGIAAALSDGDEAIDIIQMTCVKYDHTFANHMKVKFAEYQDKRKGKKGGGSPKKVAGKQLSKKPTPKAQPQHVDMGSDVGSDADVAGHSEAEYVVREDFRTSALVSTAPEPRLRRSARKSVMSFVLEHSSDDELVWL